VVICLARWVIVRVAKYIAERETNMKLTPRQIANRIDDVINRTRDEETILLLKDLKGLVLQQEEASNLNETN